MALRKRWAPPLSITSIAVAMSIAPTPAVGLGKGRSNHAGPPDHAGPNPGGGGLFDD